MPKLQLTQGNLHYRDEGTGPPVVFVHGVLVNGGVWDDVVGSLSRDVRCVVPELPLGSHPEAMNEGADLSPPGLARLIAETIERLGLDVGRLVLTNCDAFENFPPASFRLAIRLLARVPGAVAGLDLLGRSRLARRSAMSIAPLTMQPPSDDRLKGWLRPLHDRAIRRDLIRVLRGISLEHTLEAADRLRSFERPALLVWGMRDRFFDFADAERLAQALPDARIAQVQDARTFVQLDAPGRLAELIRDFVAAPAASSAPA